MFNLKKQKGITLLESMMAIFVFTIGVVALLQIFFVAFNMERVNQKQTQAIFLAQNKMEQLLFLNYNDLAVGEFLESDLGEDFKGFQRETKVFFVDSNLEQTGGNIGLKKIEIKVSWPAVMSFFPKEVAIFSLTARR